jgi:hypothetical protein
LRAALSDGLPFSETNAKEIKLEVGQTRDMPLRSREGYGSV